MDCDAENVKLVLEGQVEAGGFIGYVDTELPATNWSITEGTGSLIIKDCTASNDVTATGSAAPASVIGYVDNVANIDAKEGNVLAITIENVTRNTAISAVYKASIDSDLTKITVG